MASKPPQSGAGNQVNGHFSILSLLQVFYRFTYPQPEKRKKESILDLSKYLEKGVRIKFAGGRECSGILKGYDPLLNIVVDNTVEYLRWIIWTCAQDLLCSSSSQPGFYGSNKYVLIFQRSRWPLQVDRGHTAPRVSRLPRHGCCARLPSGRHGSHSQPLRTTRVIVTQETCSNVKCANLNAKMYCWYFVYFHWEFLMFSSLSSVFWRFLIHIW